MEWEYNNKCLCAWRCLCLKSLKTTSLWTFFFFFPDVKWTVGVGPPGCSGVGEWMWWGWMWEDRPRGCMRCSESENKFWAVDSVKNGIKNDLIKDNSIWEAFAGAFLSTDERSRIAFVQVSRRPGSVIAFSEKERRWRTEVLDPKGSAKMEFGCKWVWSYERFYRQWYHRNVWIFSLQVRYKMKKGTKRELK